VAHLVHGDRQEVAGPQVGIYAQGEDGEIPGTVRKELLDEPDILRLADRLDLDGGALLWPVVRAQGTPLLISTLVVKTSDTLYSKVRWHNRQMQKTP